MDAAPRPMATAVGPGMNPARPAPGEDEEGEPEFDSNVDVPVQNRPPTQPQGSSALSAEEGNANTAEDVEDAAGEAQIVTTMQQAKAVLPDRQPYKDAAPHPERIVQPRALGAPDRLAQDPGLALEYVAGKLWQLPPAVAKLNREKQALQKELEEMGLEPGDEESKETRARRSGLLQSLQAKERQVKHMNDTPLSDFQLEAVLAAISAHQKKLPDGITSTGFLLGDGTGVGKGRTVAAIIMEYFANGHNRALWVVPAKDLHGDCVRDLRDVCSAGMSVPPVFALDVFPGRVTDIKTCDSRVWKEACVNPEALKQEPYVSHPVGWGGVMVVTYSLLATSIRSAMADIDRLFREVDPEFDESGFKNKGGKGGGKGGKGKAAAAAGEGVTGAGAEDEVFNAADLARGGDGKAGAGKRGRPRGAGKAVKEGSQEQELYEDLLFDTSQRMLQVVHWLAGGLSRQKRMAFSGAMVFDESHKAKNYLSAAALQGFIKTHNLAYEKLSTTARAAMRAEGVGRTAPAPVKHVSAPMIEDGVEDGSSSSHAKGGVQTGGGGKAEPRIGPGKDTPQDRATTLSNKKWQAEAAKEGTAAGRIVIGIQLALPQGRVVYVSATSAAEPRHMAYMIRLGLWEHLAGPSEAEIKAAIGLIKKGQGREIGDVPPAAAAPPAPAQPAYQPNGAGQGPAAGFNYSAAAMAAAAAAGVPYRPGYVPTVPGANGQGTAAGAPAAASAPPGAAATNAAEKVTTDVGTLRTKLNGTSLDAGKPAYMFPTFADFLLSCADGISSMELVCQELSAAGLYKSRSLSMEGVQFSMRGVPFTPENAQLYEEVLDLCNFARQLHTMSSQIYHKACANGSVLYFDHYHLKRADETPPALPKGLPRWVQLALKHHPSQGGKSSVSESGRSFVTDSAAWGLINNKWYASMQRICKQLLTAIKTEEVAKVALEAIREGRAPVITLTTTGEANAKKAIERQKQGAAAAAATAAAGGAGAGRSREAAAAAADDPEGDEEEDPAGDDLNDEDIVGDVRDEAAVRGAGARAGKGTKAEVEADEEEGDDDENGAREGQHDDIYNVSVHASMASLVQDIPFPPMPEYLVRHYNLYEQFRFDREGIKMRQGSVRRLFGLIDFKQKEKKELTAEGLIAKFEYGRKGQGMELCPEVDLDHATAEEELNDEQLQRLLELLSERDRYQDPETAWARAEQYMREQEYLKAYCAFAMMVQALAEKLDQLKSKLPPNPLDHLIAKLGGVDSVAEMTGRSIRTVYDRQVGAGDYVGVPLDEIPPVVRDSMKQVHLRRNAVNAQGKIVAGAKLNKLERDKFQAGTAKAAIISGAAQSGISLHADKRARNQKQRLHITLEPPWSAEQLTQTLGRSFRANQVNLPEFVFFFAAIPGEYRFAAAVAARMMMLGALTKGDRRATSADMNAFDLINARGSRALRNFFDAIGLVKPGRATAKSIQPEAYGDFSFLRDATFIHPTDAQDLEYLNNWTNMGETLLKKVAQSLSGASFSPQAKADAAAAVADSASGAGAGTGAENSSASSGVAVSAVQLLPVVSSEEEEEDGPTNVTPSLFAGASAGAGGNAGAGAQAAELPAAPVVDPIHSNPVYQQARQILQVDCASNPLRVLAYIRGLLESMGMFSRGGLRMPYMRKTNPAQTFFPPRIKASGKPSAAGYAPPDYTNPVLIQQAVLRGTIPGLTPHERQAAAAGRWEELGYMGLPAEYMGGGGYGPGGYGPGGYAPEMQTGTEGMDEDCPDKGCPPPQADPAMVARYAAEGRLAPALAAANGMRPSATGTAQSSSSVPAKTWQVPLGQALPVSACTSSSSSAAAVSSSTSSSSASALKDVPSKDASSHTGNPSGKRSPSGAEGPGDSPGPTGPTVQDPRGRTFWFDGTSMETQLRTLLHGFEGVAGAPEPGFRLTWGPWEVLTGELSSKRVQCVANSRFTHFAYSVYPGEKQNVAALKEAERALERDVRGIPSALLRPQAANSGMDGTPWIREADKEDVARFLNRLLQLPPAQQSIIFALFDIVFRATIDAMKNDGSFDPEAMKVGSGGLFSPGVSVALGPQILAWHDRMKVELPTTYVQLEDDRGASFNTAIGAFYFYHMWFQQEAQKRQHAVDLLLPPEEARPKVKSKKALTKNGRAVGAKKKNKKPDQPTLSGWADTRGRSGAAGGGSYATVLSSKSAAQLPTGPISAVASGWGKKGAMDLSKLDDYAMGAESRGTGAGTGAQVGGAVAHVDMLDEDEDGSKTAGASAAGADGPTNEADGDDDGPIAPGRRATGANLSADGSALSNVQRAIQMHNATVEARPKSRFEPGAGDKRLASLSSAPLGRAAKKPRSDGFGYRDGDNDSFLASEDEEEDGIQTDEDGDEQEGNLDLTRSGGRSDDPQVTVELTDDDWTPAEIDARLTRITEGLKKREKLPSQNAVMSLPAFCEAVGKTQAYVLSSHFSPYYSKDASESVPTSVSVPVYEHHPMRIPDPAEVLTKAGASGFAVEVTELPEEADDIDVLRSTQAAAPQAPKSAVKVLRSRVDSALLEPVLLTPGFRHLAAGLKRPNLPPIGFYRGKHVSDVVLLLVRPKAGAKAAAEAATEAAFTAGREDRTWVADTRAFVQPSAWYSVGDLLSINHSRLADGSGLGAAFDVEWEYFMVRPTAGPEDVFMDHNAIPRQGQKWNFAQWWYKNYVLLNNYAQIQAHWQQMREWCARCCVHRAYQDHAAAIGEAQRVPGALPEGTEMAPPHAGFNTATTRAVSDDATLQMRYARFEIQYQNDFMKGCKLGCTQGQRLVSVHAFIGSKLPVLHTLKQELDKAETLFIEQRYPFTKKGREAVSASSMAKQPEGVDAMNAVRGGTAPAPKPPTEWKVKVKARKPNGQLQVVWAHKSAMEDLPPDLIVPPPRVNVAHILDLQTRLGHVLKWKWQQARTEEERHVDDFFVPLLQEALEDRFSSAGTTTSALTIPDEYAQIILPSVLKYYKDSIKYHQQNAEKAGTSRTLAKYSQQLSQLSQGYTQNSAASSSSGAGAGAAGSQVEPIDPAVWAPAGRKIPGGCWQQWASGARVLPSVLKFASAVAPLSTVNQVKKGKVRVLNGIAGLEDRPLLGDAAARAVDAGKETSSEEEEDGYRYADDSTGPSGGSRLRRSSGVGAGHSPTNAESGYKAAIQAMKEKKQVNAFSRMMPAGSVPVGAAGKRAIVDDEDDMMAASKKEAMAHVSATSTSTATVRGGAIVDTDDEDEDTPLGELQKSYGSGGRPSTGSAATGAGAAAGKGTGKGEAAARAPRDEESDVILLDDDDDDDELVVSKPKNVRLSVGSASAAIVRPAGRSSTGSTGSGGLAGVRRTARAPVPPRKRAKGSAIVDSEDEEEEEDDDEEEAVPVETDEEEDGEYGEDDDEEEEELRPRGRGKAAGKGRPGASRAAPAKPDTGRGDGRRSMSGAGRLMPSASPDDLPKAQPAAADLSTRGSGNASFARVSSGSAGAAGGRDVSVGSSLLSPPSASAAGGASVVPGRLFSASDKPGQGKAAALMQEEDDDDEVVAL